MKARVKDHEAHRFAFLARAYFQGIWLFYVGRDLRLLVTWDTLP